MSSPILWGPNNTSNSLQNALLLSGGALINSNGPKNYVTGGTFENGLVGGWTATGCATVTNGLPVTVGAGGFSFSSTNGGRAKGANTSNPAIDASSAVAGVYALNLATTGAGTIGDGYISIPFVIDPADRAKILSYKLYYKSVTGTPNMSGTSANTYAVAIYDLINNSWIIPTGAFNFVQSSGVGIAQGTFQTPSNMSAFQIFIYSPIAPIAASSILLDDIAVSPQSLAFGPPVTDWVPWTPTIVGLGTTTNNLFLSRRSGDCLEISGTCSTGTATGSIVTITPGFNGINNNVAIDTTKVGAAVNTVVGSMAFGVNVTTSFTVLASAGSPGVFYFGVQNASNNGLTAATGTTISGAPGQNISFFARIPIAGWSASTVMSADSDTSVVAFSADVATTAYTSSTPVIFTNVSGDTHGGYNIATGRYTIKVTGWYDVQGSLYSAATALSVNIFKNGANFSQFPGLSSATQSVGGTDTFYLLAGDIIDLRGNASCTLTNTARLNRFTVTRLSGPAVVAQSPSPRSYVRVDTCNGYGSTNNKIRRFTTVVDNLGSAITYADSAANGATFTINEDGLYTISFTDQYSSGGNTPGISRNSNQLTTAISGITQTHRLKATHTPANDFAANVSVTVFCQVNDIIRAHTSGTSSGASTWSESFTIMKVAN